MSSVRQIAKQAGVSITTVSRVLNNHPRVSERLREKVLAAANESRYVAAVGKRSTTNIAFVYTGEPSLGSPFDGALMQGMSNGMDEFGYDLMVLDVRRARQPDETYSQMFMRKGVRGAVLRTNSQTRSVCEAIATEGFPCVVLGDRFDHPGINFIFSDSRETSREAVDYLLDLGHRRVAICLNIVDDSDHADRLAGYEQALRDRGLPVERRNVLRTAARRDGGEQLMRRLAAMADRPTAVYFTDPASAAGAVKEARALGIDIPGDLSVVGFDDHELRHDVYPELTAVCQDAVAMGHQAFAALHEILDREDGSPVTKKSLRTWFEVHRSTAPPRSDDAPSV
ncbi:MAG: LacI family DNA-binding transcriptional regulator [Planctomycetota bacterium]